MLYRKFDLQKNNFLLFFFLPIFIFSSTSSQAATYYSVASGLWSASGTWSLSSGGTALTSGGPGSSDNVIIEGGFTVTIDANPASITVANITIGSASNGTLTISSSTTGNITITGDLTIGGSSGSGTLNYDNPSNPPMITCGSLRKGVGTATRQNPIYQDFTFTGNFTLPSDAQFSAFGSFKIANGGNVTLSRNISTNGPDVAIAASGTLNTSTHAIDMSALPPDFNILGTLILGGNSGGISNSNFPDDFYSLTIGPNSTVEYSYSGNQTILPATYNNLIISGSGTKSVATIGVVTGLSLTNGGSNYNCTPSVTFSGTGGASATVTVAAAAPYAITGVQLTNGGSGYISAPSVSVSCGSGSGAVITATIDRIITNNLTLNASAAMSASKDLFVTNSLLVNSGATLTVGGLFTANGSSQTINGNLIISSTGTLSVPGSKTLNVNGLLTSSGSSAISGNLDISTSGTLAVPSGTFTTNSLLTLKASSAGSARIAASSGTISGNCNIEFYIPGGRRAFRLLGNPFSSGIALSSLTDDIHITGPGGSGSGFDATTTNNPSAFTFNESAYNSTVSNSGWQAFTSTSQTIDTKKAARILYRGPKTQSNLLDGTNPTPLACILDWSGPVNQGNVAIPLSYTSANAGNAGWNLIPNPYPSNVNIGNIASGNRNNINNFSVWIPNNGTRGAYTTISFGSSYIIPAYSAFFVQTVSAGNFTFTESDKTSSAASVNLLKSDLLKENALQLNVLSNDTIFWDQFVLRNRVEGENTLDNWDAIKMENPDVNFSSILSSGTNLAIDYRNLGAVNTLDLNFTSSAPYAFTFKVDHLNLPDYSVILKDFFTNKETTLSSNTSYHFTTTSNPLSSGKERFKLILHNKTNGLDPHSSHNQNVIVYPNPAANQLNIAIKESGKGIYAYELFDELGQVLTTGTNDFNANPNYALNISALKTGVYFLKVENQNKNQIVKFIKTSNE